MYKKQGPDEKPLLLSVIPIQCVKELVSLKVGHTIFCKPQLHQEDFLLSFSIHFCMKVIFAESRLKH